MKQSLVNQTKQRLKEAAEQEPEQRARTLLDIQEDLDRFRKNPHIDEDTVIRFEEDVEERLAELDDHATAVREGIETASRASRICQMVLSLCPWIDDPSNSSGEKNGSSSFGD